MSLVEKVKSQKLLSFTLILFTLSIGVLIGTLVSTGVKAAKDQAAPGVLAEQVGARGQPFAEAEADQRRDNQP